MERIADLLYYGLVWRFAERRNNQKDALILAMWKKYDSRWHWHCGNKLWASQDLIFWRAKQNFTKESSLHVLSFFVWRTWLKWLRKQNLLALYTLLYSYNIIIQKFLANNQIKPSLLSLAHLELELFIRGITWKYY